MLAGTNSGVGKTTISLGIMGYLSKKFNVMPFKVGPDYIDTSYHRFATGNYSCNLDLYMLGVKNLKELFAKYTKMGDVSIIEGVMGLYDGIDTTKKGSSGDVARLLNVPVILVVDASEMAASVSAMVMGYINYDKDVNIKGVILNKAGGEDHYRLLKECIKRDLGIEVFGYLPSDVELSLPERHLGLVPTCEMKGLNEKFDRLYTYIEKYIDVEGILDSCNIELDDEVDNGNLYVNAKDKVSIAFAHDEAFNFYYQDSLEILKKMGAELVPFSLLYDSNLPVGISGIYIGGGFPEMFTEKLSLNKKMISSIKNAIEKGMPVYAECGGLMYLTKSIKDLEGNTYDMVGIYDAYTVMTKRLNHFGYVEAEVLSDNVLFKKDDMIRGHEFHYSKLEGYVRNFSYIVHKPKRNESWPCGYVYKNCLATYVHINLYTYPDAAKRFIINCNNFITGDVCKCR